MPARRRFQLVLVKPSHYDDDGYVIRWWRAMIPSNSLAAVYGIAVDCAERQVLGPDVAIDIEAIDETHTRVNVPKLLEQFRSHGNFGLLALVGVQSNQYPRALDIARPFRAADIPVAIGGSHVSGCVSMLDGRAVDLDACRDMGVSMFAGEAEGRLELVLQDAAAGRLAPLYDFMRNLPDIEGTPVPFLPKPYVERTRGLSTSFDAGRGCPYQCSFCTIINVQGRKSRFRTADDVEHLVRLNWAHPRMNREQWEAIYREAWSLYYTPKHMETLLRRAVATGVPVNSLIKVLVNFATTTRLENVHPLQGGIFRLKHPSERRPGQPRERAVIFWPRFLWETLSKHAVIVATIARLLVLKFVIMRDPAARTYKDIALTPVSDDEEMTLNLLTNTTGAHAAVTHSKKIARLTGVARSV